MSKTHVIQLSFTPFTNTKSNFQDSKTKCINLMESIENQYKNIITGMKKNILMLSAAIVAAVLTSCGGGQQGLPTSNEYPVITVGTSNAQLKTTYPATIKGVQDVEIRPKVSGFITRLAVHEGETVKAGQVLFVIDNVTYQAAVRQAQAAVNSANAQVAQAQAAVSSANAQLATARLTYTNSRNLYNNKVIGNFELETAKNSYETAAAAANQAKMGVEAARAAVNQAQAGLANAKENLSFCYVKSPANGVVGSLPFKEGALVSPSSIQPVTTVSNSSTVEVYFSMTESDILKMSRDGGNLQSAIEKFPKVQLQLADGTIYNHEGAVIKSSGVIDPTTGTVSVIARFPNPEHLLKSGGSGQIVVAKNNNNALVIPQEATTQVQDKIFVYKVDENNKVHYSEIQINTQNDGKNYIVTGGLKMGEKIVSKGLSSLQDGAEIKPLTPEEYDKAIEKAEKLGEKQKTAGGFLDAMKGGGEDANKKDEKD